MGFRNVIRNVKAAFKKRLPMSETYEVSLMVMNDMRYEVFKNAVGELEKLRDLVTTLTGEVCPNPKRFLVEVKIVPLEVYAIPPFIETVSLDELLHHPITFTHPLAKLCTRLASWGNTSLDEAVDVWRDSTLCIDDGKASLIVDRSLWKCRFMSLSILDVNTGKQPAHTGAPLAARLDQFNHSGVVLEFQKWLNRQHLFWLDDLKLSCGQRSITWPLAGSPAATDVMSHLLDDPDLLNDLGWGDIVPVASNPDNDWEWRFTATTAKDKQAWVVTTVDDLGNMVKRNTQTMLERCEAFDSAAKIAGMSMGDPEMIVHAHSDKGDFTDVLINALRAIYEKHEGAMERASEALERLRERSYKEGVVVTKIDVSPRPGLARGALRVDVELMVGKTFVETIETLSQWLGSETRISDVIKRFHSRTEVFTLYNA